MKTLDANGRWRDESGRFTTPPEEEEIFGWSVSLQYRPEGITDDYVTVDDIVYAGTAIEALEIAVESAEEKEGIIGFLLSARVERV